MGRTFMQFEDLGTPLARVQDRVMSISKGRRIVVENSNQKIVVFLEGRVTAWINGAVVGEVGPGDALVVPGPCRQDYVPLLATRETRLHALIMVFSRGLFACDEGTLRAVPVAGADAERSPENFIRAHFGRVQLRQGVLTPAAMESIEALRREGVEKGPGHRLRASAYALLLLTEIARQEPASAPAPAVVASRQAWMVEQVKNFLLEHHAEELTLDQVAWHLRLSAEHVARTFRKETGRTIFGYVQHLRIERAKTLLTGSQLTVNEIARQTGFGSASHLCRLFKQGTGQSPLAYRLRTVSDSEFSPSVTEEIAL